MNFSLMVPTRNRGIMLSNLIESIVNNTQELDNTEIIVIYDNDDNSTKQISENLLLRFKDKISLIFHARERSFNMSNDYFNYVANNLSTGKYLIALNDDTKFIKYAWDSEAIKKIDKYLEDKPDGIFYGITEDREIERKRNEHYWFSCFPLVSKKAVEALGFFFDPFIWKDGADWDLLALYKNLNRVLDLRLEIIIEHISVRSGRRGKDALDEENVHIHNHKIPKVSAGYNTQNYMDYLKDYILRYNSEVYKNTNFLKLVQEEKWKSNKAY